jgi:dTDP-4-amino-4,6-dideoxygalactose transaminase
MPSNESKGKLAINGGTPVRHRKMPPRMAFGDDEAASVMRAIEYYRSREEDPPYDGVFKAEYCQAFSDFMGGGYTDAVSTGTASVYVALAALDLPKKSEVIIAPVTDSGPLNCIIMQDLVPVLADAAPDSYNMGVDQFVERITPNTTALLAVHCAGEPLEIDRIVEEAHRRGVKVLEDCSQATGGTWNEKRVGSFGDVAAFSTMYRKTLTAGASSGLVYSIDEDIYHTALAHADRGKPSWKTDINPNDPGISMFPALNFNTDELSCSIGLASLARLQSAIDGRVNFLAGIVERLPQESQVCRPYAFNRGFSPFFFPIFVDLDRITCNKAEFTDALSAEGVDLNPHYGCVVSSWEWASQYMSDDFVAENAEKTRDNSFNLFLNEQYGDQELEDVLGAIKKVEAHYSK